MAVSNAPPGETRVAGTAGPLLAEARDAFPWRLRFRHFKALTSGAPGRASLRKPKTGTVRVTPRRPHGLICAQTHLSARGRRLCRATGPEPPPQPPPVHPARKPLRLRGRVTALLTAPPPDAAARRGLLSSDQKRVSVPTDLRTRQARCSRRTPDSPCGRHPTRHVDSRRAKDPQVAARVTPQEPPALLRAAAAAGRPLLGRR